MHGSPREGNPAAIVTYISLILHFKPLTRAGSFLTRQLIVGMAALGMLSIKNAAAGEAEETVVAASPKKRNWEDVYAERKQWWSLQPLMVVSPPLVGEAEWVGRAVDRFLRSRMTAENMAPSPIADQETLLRRATLVLTGLPPRTADLDSFLAASRQSPSAAYAVMEIGRAHV